MSYQINLGCWNEIFAVPAAVVDQHIKIASEAQLKVLLYLLRHSGKSLETSDIAKALNLSDQEAENAVEFWAERGLLTSVGDSLTPAQGEQKVSVPVAESQPAISEKPKKPHTTVSRAQRPDPMFVSKLLKEDVYLASLLENIQSDLNKPLSPGDTATIVMLYDTFGLPCEVIALLIEYLKSIGCANMRSIEKYGIRWADDGIKTAADAEREIDRMTHSREAWGSVSSLLGIRNIGNPTKSQLDHANRWVNEWGFSDEMIVEAYERCVNTKGEYNIRYINAILQKWNNKGIKSLDTLKEEESAAKNKQKKKTSPKGSVFSTENASFDVSEYEESSLFDD